MSKGKVSVIIPCYNAAETIKRTVDSLKQQTYRDLEVIIVDDCSTDGSGEICKDIAKDWADVKLVFHTINGGQTITRTDGIANCSGDWMLFLDADDVLASDVIENLMLIASAKDPDIILAGYETISEKQEKKEYRADVPEGLYTSEEFGKYLLDSIPSNVLTCVGSKLYKTEFVKGRKDKTGLEVKTNWDMAFIIDALISCQSVYYYDAVCYTYLLRNGSITYSYRNNMYSAICFARRRIREYLEKCGCYEEKKLLLELMQYSLITNSLKQEVKYGKGYQHFRKALWSIAEHERTKKTADIILHANTNRKYKTIMKLVMAKKARTLYAIFGLWYKLHG